MESLLAVLAIIGTSVYVTGGVRFCGDVQVHLIEEDDQSFPEVACCWLNGSRCLWESIGQPSEIVDQRVDLGTGRVIHDVTN